MFATTPRSLSGANHSVSSSAPLSTRPHVLVENDERAGFRQAGMQPRPELAGSREGSPRIEHESGSRLGVALLDALYGDFAAVELHGLARTCAFNGLEDRRHCRDAHKLLPMTVELAR